MITASDSSEKTVPIYPEDGGSRFLQNDGTLLWRQTQQVSPKCPQVYLPHPNDAVAIHREDRGSRFLRNVGTYVPNYTESHFRRQFLYTNPFDGYAGRRKYVTFILNVHFMHFVGRHWIQQPYQSFRSLTAFTLHYLRTWSLLLPKYLHGTCWQAHGTHTSLVHGSMQNAVCPICLWYSGIYSSGSQAFRVRCPSSSHTAPSRPPPRAPNHLRHLHINRFK
jgi:hypothetical protein